MYEFRGKRPRIAPDAWVAPTATLIGDVEVASGASVWYGATLRGDMDRIAVGARTSVQDNAVIHADAGEPTIIGAGCTLGHGAIVHSSIVEENVLIGTAAVLTGRNRVGSGTIVAAGAVLPEGMEIPAGQLAVGVPARVVRPARPEDERWTKGASDHYAELGAEYRTSVREVPS
jgi:carbonic anhydrase/acetyltransferase-like protein (isoleucine patch superfamily)